MSKDKQKAALLDAAQAVFDRKGAKGTTLEEVAKEAKVDLKTAKTIYPKMEGLIQDIFSRDIEETSDLFTRIINERGKADIKLTRLVRELLQRYQKSYPLFQVVAVGLESADTDEEFLKDLLKPEHIEKYRQNTAIVGRLIAQGQSENLFTDVDPLEAAYVLRGMIGAAIRFRRFAQKDDDVRDHADMIMRIFLKGLLR